MKRNSKLLTTKTFISVCAGLLMTVSLPALASSKVTYRPAAPLSPAASVKADGIQMIHLGETYRLVIPSSRLFNPDSANLRCSAHGVLNDVRAFLNSYHIVSIQVASYSDNVKPGIRKQALTNRQAEVVQSYLSDHGIFARLIVANGQGDSNPVASNHTSAGRHDNRRVEISFRYIPTTTIYETTVKK